MTVGLCVDVVEIGLATHLRYIRYGRTELQPEPLRGAPPQWTSYNSLVTSECRALWGERERGHAVEIGGSAFTVYRTMHASVRTYARTKSPFAALRRPRGSLTLAPIS